MAKHKDSIRLRNSMLQYMLALLQHGFTADGARAKLWAMYDNIEGDSFECFLEEVVQILWWDRQDKGIESIGIRVDAANNLTVTGQEGWTIYELSHCKL